MFLFFAFVNWAFASPPISTELTKVKKEAGVKKAANIKTNCCPEVQFHPATIVNDDAVYMISCNYSENNKKAEAVPGAYAGSQEVDVSPQTIVVFNVDNDTDLTTASNIAGEVPFPKRE